MKRALIVGLGKSGQASWCFLKEQGFDLCGVDQKATHFQGDPIFKEEDFHGFDSLDMVVKSPGIPFSHPVIQEAVQKGIPITSEIELALNELQHTNKTLFAITGSNGKTTTTLLLTHLLKSNNRTALALGNIGNSLLAHLNAPEDFFCIELSSFQLEKLVCPVFDAGAILNITPNHLDRYESFEEYAAAKFQLQYCLKKGGKLFLHSNTEHAFSSFIAKETKEKVATITALRYRDEGFSLSPHDWENLAVASQFCKLAGMDDEAIWKGLIHFQKPPHRIEFVRQISGVNYINDSKATSVDAVQKAVEAMKGEVVLIAGGLDKNGDFTSWGEAFQKKVKTILLIGNAAEKIAKEIGNKIPVEIVETLEVALKRANNTAKKGQSVLFSPGCASFDQFTNYEHRGNVFKELVYRMGENHES